jgi:phosphatidylserine/phosphatidylglycerophosphate/cardiolipin synthase-like enzyme
LQVVNYHRPIFGTFHSKYMVIDRRIAIVQSNNLQDNDNLEMMVQLEGPIVDSFYDVALISWHNALNPPLPMLNSPAADNGFPSFQNVTHRGMFDESGTLKALTGNVAPDASQATAKDAVDNADATVTKAGQKQALPQNTSSDPHFDPDIAAEVTRIQSFMTPRNGESHMNAVTRCLSMHHQFHIFGEC